MKSKEAEDSFSSDDFFLPENKKRTRSSLRNSAVVTDITNDSSEIKRSKSSSSRVVVHIQESNTPRRADIKITEEEVQKTPSSGGTSTRWAVPDLTSGNFALKCCSSKDAELS